MLDESGACILYDFRPVICRTHGLPVLFEDDDGTRRVDFCPQNFGDMKKMTGAHLLDIDHLNQMLAAVNAAFCKEALDGAFLKERFLVSEALALELL